MVLLDMLTREGQVTGSEFIVAHFDHGIRPDSALDAQFVAQLAINKNLPFITERAELGEDVSEDKAREARYEFLRRVKNQYSARAIITAHHQDDVLETIAMHLLRGAGRQGLDPMRRTLDIERPLLGYPKAAMYKTAHEQGLKWRHDSTNDDSRYFRNKIRKLYTTFDPGSRKALLELHARVKAINDEIDVLLKVINEWTLNDAHIVRSRFVQLPYVIQKEVVHSWLQQNNIYDFDKSQVERIVLAAKTLAIGKKLDINNAYWLKSTQTSLRILRK